MLTLGLAAAAPNPDFGVGEHHEHHEDHGEDHGEAGEHHGDHEDHEAKVPEKKCELVRADTATSPECFLEPECEKKCTQDFKQVFRVAIILCSVYKLDTVKQGQL